MLCDPVRRTDETTVGVGETREHNNDAQVPVLAQRIGQRAGRIGRPEVLILDVDQPPGSSERLEVGAGDASLALSRKRIGRMTRRVRSQHLDGVRTDRWRRRR